MFFYFCVEVFRDADFLYKLMVFNGTEHPYKYNGMEHEEELGLDMEQGTTTQQLEDGGRLTHWQNR